MATKTLTLDPLLPDRTPAKGTRLWVSVDRDVAIKGTGTVARKGALKDYVVGDDGTFPTIDVIPNDDDSLQEWSLGYALIIEAEKTPRGGVTGSWTVSIASDADDQVRLSDLGTALPVPTQYADAATLLADSKAAQAAAASSASDAASSAALVGAPAGDAIDAHLGGDSTGLVTAVTSNTNNITAITPDNSQRAVGKGELIINAADYITPNTGTAQDNTDLNAAITSASAYGPIRVYFPRGGYKLTASLPSVGYVTYCSDAMGSGDTSTGATLSADTGVPLLAPDKTLYGLRFENLTLAAGTDGGHLIDLDAAAVPGSPGGLVFTHFNRCYIALMGNTGASFLSGGQSGTLINNFFDVHIDGCRIERSATATVPAVNLRSSIGGLNHVFFHGGWVHSHGNSTVPAIKIEGASATQPIGDLIFDGLIGEQNNCGLLSIGGVNGCRIHNVKDWDTTGSYAASLFDFYTPSGGAASRGVWVEGSGTPQAATFSTGCYHLSIQAGGDGHHVGRVVNGAVMPLLKVPTTGLHVKHSGGDARSFRVITANTTVTETDDVLICNGSSALTVTLPVAGALLNSGTVPLGRCWTITNSAGAAADVTVTAPGSATIDGSDPVTLAPGERMTVLYNGANFWVVS